MDQLEAPHKQRLVFEHAGLRHEFGQEAEFASVMRRISASSRAAVGG